MTISNKTPKVHQELFALFVQSLMDLFIKILDISDKKEPIESKHPFSLSSVSSIPKKRSLIANQRIFWPPFYTKIRNVDKFGNNVNKLLNKCIVDKKHSDQVLQCMKYVMNEIKTVEEESRTSIFYLNDQINVTKNDSVEKKFIENNGLEGNIKFESFILTTSITHYLKFV